MGRWGMRSEGGECEGGKEKEGGKECVRKGLDDKSPRGEGREKRRERKGGGGGEMR